MTYADDILSKDNHKIGYRITFDGVTEELSTHSTIVGITPGSTVYPVILKPPSGSGSSLDRTRSLIMPGGFSVEIGADQDIVELFARRGGTEGTLKDAIEPAATTLEFNDGLIYSAGQNIYIEKETITLGPVVGSTYTACIRGAPATNGSERQAHRSGAIASDRPRYWLGRRATLYAVDLETGNAGSIRTGVLSSSPRFVNGKYELRFIDLQREFNRKLYTGWTAQPGEVFATTVTQAKRSFTVLVPDVREFVTSTNSHVLVEFGEAYAVFRMFPTSINTSLGAIELIIESTTIDGTLVGWGGSTDLEELKTFFGSVPEDGPSQVSMRTVCLVTGSPAYCALQLMNSRTGDLTNGPYDVLPGVSVADITSGAETIDRTPKRMGAGLPQDWIDSASWEAVVPGDNIVVLLESPTTLLEFLENEICWLLGGYVYINTDGKIAFKKYEPAVPAGSLDLYDDSDIINMARSVVDDETEIIASGLIECDYDYGRGEFTKEIEVAWTPTYQTYGEGRAQLHFKSKTVRTLNSNMSANLSSAMTTETQLVTMLDRIYARTRDGVLKVKISVPWKYSARFVPGYIFKFSDATLPSDGVSGFVGKQFEVVGTNVNYEAGRVEIEAEEQPRGWLIAPSAFVQSTNPLSTGIRVNFDLTGDEALLFDLQPGFDFISGCSVRFYQAAAVPSFSTSFVKTDITTGLPNSIAIPNPGGSTPPFPVVGDLCVLEITANTGFPNSIGADVDDHLFCGDSSLHPPSFFGGLVNKWS